MGTVNSHEASPSTICGWSYQVFVSSRAEDTRRAFTSHLCHALFSVGWRYFRDAKLIARGDDIVRELQKAIEGSRVFIIVLSKNYASSRCCVNELVMILKLMSSGHLVLPVFYDVNPSKVKMQNGRLKNEWRIEMDVDKQKEYLKGKVQEWRMALEEVANLAGFQIPPNYFEAYESKIIQHVHVKVTELVTTNNRAHPGRQDRCDFNASCLEDGRTRGKRRRDGISSHVFSLDILQQHFGSKRADVAQILGISVSTLKRICRYHGIPRWPNRIRSSVSGLPNPYGEKNPLPMFTMLSTNGQITMENEVGGQNLEPNECLPDSFEDPNFHNTRIGSISEFGKTPTFYDSFTGHTDFGFFAVYSETEASGGPSEWVIEVEGKIIQFTACSNSNAPVFPQPHIASEEVLNEYGGSSEDRRDSLASQAEASFEGHVSESSNLTINACSDAAAPNQTLATMPTVPDIVPHLTRGSSETFHIEKEMGGQIQEPNEFLPEPFQDPSLWDTGGGSPRWRFHRDHCDVDFCFSSMYNETGAAGGSPRGAFQLEGRTTQIPSYPIPDVLVSKPPIAPIEVLSENMGRAEDRRILLASQETSQEKAFLQVPHFIGGSTGCSGCPNLCGIVDPHPQKASTQILSENMRTLENLSISLVSQEEPFMEEYASGSINQTIPSCLDPAPSQQPMMPPSSLVDPHPQMASTQIPSDNMATSEDLSIFLVSQEPFMKESGSGSNNQTIPSCLDPGSSQQPRMPPLIASQDTSSVRVKATNGHTTIAFKLSFASGIIQLKEEVSKRLGFELGNFNLKYKDADGDMVSIVCDDDVRDYLQLLSSLGNQVSKLFVS